MVKPLYMEIKALLLFIVSLCLFVSVHAQDVAEVVLKKSPLFEEPYRERKNKKTLFEFLQSLEEAYPISFAYQKKYLDGKYVSNKSAMLSGDIESSLKKILAPLDLDFKKIENIDEKIYVIHPIGQVEEDVFQAAAMADSAVRTKIHSQGDPRDFDSDEKSTFITVQGKVTSGVARNPAAGVNIIIKGTTSGTTTDEEGNYTLSILGSDATIVFSFIGFNTEEVPVNNRTIINVALQENTNELPEVVVTSLGISREQKSLGYSVSTITADEVTASGNTNFASALYGKAAGMRISASPGGATSAVNIQIRGVNSLNYNSQPLYVIDGVLMRDSNEKGAAGVNNDEYWVDQRIRGNGILDINPSDIESLTVLKGASATALYGSDAASGVIVITTKKGSSRPGLGIDLNYTFNIEEVAFTPSFQNIYGPGADRATNLANGADENGWVPIDNDQDGIAETRRPLFESYGQFGPRMDGHEVMWWDGTMRNYSPQPDNYKNFYRQGYNSIFNVAVSNQAEKISYRFAYTRNDYEGIQVGGKLTRNTISLNTALRLNDRLSVDVIANYVNSSVHNRPLKINRLTSSYNGFFSRAEDMSLFFDKYKTSSGYKWVSYDQSQLNPEEALRYTTPKGYEVMNFLWKQLTNSEDENQHRIISSATIDYRIAKGLSLRGRVGSDFTSLLMERKEHNEYPIAFNGTNSTGGYAVSNGTYAIVYTDALLAYSKQIGQDFNFSVNGGFQLRDEQYRDQSTGTNGGLVVENWFSISNSNNAVLNTSVTRSKILKYAYLGILNFSYKDYLFLEGTARQEYSSTLPPGRNSYFYPSVNSGFVFTDAFQVPAFLNYGKVRAAFGVVGNSPPAYEANILYNITPLQTANGTVISSSAQGDVYGNNGIKSENKYELELGLETKVLHNKLGIDLTYYNSRIKDQIVRLDLPTSTGARRILSNAGELRSQGWELAFSSTPVSGVVTWNTRFNFAANQTKVHRLMDGMDRLVFRSFEQNAIQVVAEEGESIGNIYVYPRKTDENGNYIISEDPNSQGLYVIDKTRYVKAGNVLPKMIGGVANTISFNGFSLDFMIDYRFGGKIISPSLKYLTGAGMYESTLKYRDEEYGGLPYYFNSEGLKILLADHTSLAPDNSKVYHDGLILKGVMGNGEPNSTVIDAATYYLKTFDFGSNAWNEEGSIYDNSYVKLREAVLSYNFPLAMTNRLGFRTLRFSLIGRNLFYIWRTLRNLDPETSIGTNWVTQGYDEGSSAATRSYGFSIQANF